MSTRNTVIITLALIAIALVFSLAIYSHLPSQTASHWDVNDQVNGSMPRFWGAFMMPLIAVAMLGLFLLIPAIDPLKVNIAKFREIFNAFIVVIVVFMLYIHFLTLLWNLGYQDFRMGTAILPAMGLIFIFSGLLMRKAKRNFFIGIRTPWTLSSDNVWDQTHRVGSWLFIASGILAFAGMLVPGPTAFMFVLIPVIASAIFLIIYSYILYQKETTG